MLSVMERTAEAVAKRRQQLIALLAEEPMTFAEVRSAIAPMPSVRSLRTDMAWLQATFPQRVTVAPAGGDKPTRTLTYAWQGALPMHLDPPIDWATQEELTGLVLAQAMLGQVIGEDTFGASRFLDHHQLDGLATRVAGQVIQLSTFGAESIDHEILSTCLVTALTGQSMLVTYQSLVGRKSRHLMVPQRLVLIRNEWYCVGWAGGLRSYRVARMQAARSSDRYPRGYPKQSLRGEVDAYLTRAFYAASSADAADVEEVVLAVSPNGWPLVRDRWWGMHQRVDEAPGDLPEGWRRVRFRTAGMMACRHWVLSMGTDVRVEGPVELKQWVWKTCTSVVSQIAEVGAPSNARADRW